MVNSNIDLIGIYKVPYTEDLLKNAFKLKYEGIKIPFWKKNKTIIALKKELSSIVLIEVFVNNSDNKFNINNFGQLNSDQAPYNEVYLDEKGENIIGETYRPPSSNKLRIAFFLHFFNPTIPLKSTYGDINFRQITEIPERLNKIIKYEPVD